MTDDIRYLTKEELIAINHLLIKKYSPKEKSGVEFPGLLDSAVNRPRQSVFGEDAYKTIFEKAAALYESLAQNHAFHNANKRVAFVGMLQFLSYNKYRFVMDQKQAEIFTIDVVKHRYSFHEITEIIEKHSQPA